MTAPENFWNKILYRGLVLLFKNSTFESLKQEIISNYPELVRSNLFHLPVETQRLVIRGILDAKPEEINSEFFKGFVIEALSQLENVSDPAILAHNADWYIYLQELQDQDTKVDWFSILETLSWAQSKFYESIASFEKLSQKLISQNPDNLLKLVYKTDIKSYPREVKSRLYKQVINQGKLDLKIARRIRSDSCGALSRDMLSYLFENRKKYSDEKFQELITQFSDTKHSWVAQFIALNMPSHLLPFLIGLDDEMATKIIEKRMTNS